METLQISREIQLDYGHTLPNHFSFCNQVHGHRARVIACLSGPINVDAGASSEGMVMDFKIIKELMMSEIHDILDHGFAVWKDDPVTRPFIETRNKKVLVTNQPPTAEVLAKWAFFQLHSKLPKNITLLRTEWWETPTSCASFSL